jgi:hypothetical protein
MVGILIREQRVRKYPKLLFFALLTVLISNICHSVGLSIISNEGE